MSRTIKLPAPSARYDRDNEAALRRELEQVLSEPSPVAMAVANATGAGDVVAQFNALLSSLRAAGYVGT